MLAADIAFYAFLALLPLIVAIALIYGLVTDPAELVADVRSLAIILPDDARELLVKRTTRVLAEGEDREFGLVAALALTIYTAVLAAKALIASLNMVYHEPRRRSFVRRWRLALAIAAGGALFLLGGLVGIAILGFVEALVPEGTPILWTLLRLGSWLLMALAVSAGLAALYRFAPARENALWLWVAPGALLATLSWLTVTLLFGVYIANFGSYDAAYGSVAAVVILQIWLFLSALAVLVGAKLNAEIERQTGAKTAAGEALPIGSRGATAADQVA